MKLICLIVAAIGLVSASAQGGKDNPKNDEMMQNIQRMLMEAEKEGRADKPMMMKEVDGKMVLTEIPQDIMDTFEFPNGMMDLTNDKEEI